MTTTSVRTALIAALLGAGSVAVQAQPQRTIADCRAIEGELARYACYESLEVPGAAPAPAAPATPAATPATPPRPVTNLPVVRRPTPDVGELTRPAEAAPPQTATVRATQEEEKPSLLRRLNPFGRDDDDRADTAAPAESAPVATGDPVADFGLPTARNQARVEANKDGKLELVDTVAEIRELTRNTYDITLASGQVWRQQVTKAYPLKVGSKVTIKPTQWGKNYRLYAEDIKTFIQVKRIR